MRDRKICGSNSDGDGYTGEDEERKIFEVNGQEQPSHIKVENMRMKNIGSWNKLHIQMITNKPKNNKQQVRNIYLSLCSEIKTLFTNSTKVELNSENDIIYIYNMNRGSPRRVHVKYSRTTSKHASLQQ